MSLVGSSLKEEKNLQGSDWSVKLLESLSDGRKHSQMSLNT